MKVLSVQNPWAWAIVHGPKRIENRSWATDYKGPLLIHAGKSRARLGDYGEGEPDPDAMMYGAIIGRVTLVDCVRVGSLPPELDDDKTGTSRFVQGPWCWVLADPVALVPFVTPGKVSLFAPPPGYKPKPA